MAERPGGDPRVRRRARRGHASHGAADHSRRVAILGGRHLRGGVSTGGAASRNRSRSGGRWTCWRCPPRARSTPMPRWKPNRFQRNTDLGHYTNFVNLLDLAAVAVPAGFRRNGLPFGISLIGPAFADEALLDLAGEPVSAVSRGHVCIAVVGAPPDRAAVESPTHGSRGMAGEDRANVARVSSFMRCRTPRRRNRGLVREPRFAGPGIELEVWCMSDAAFGSFVAEVPPPLTIGTVVTEDGISCKVFPGRAICRNRSPGHHVTQGMAGVSRLPFRHVK